MSLTIYKVSTTTTSVRVGYALTGYTGNSNFVNINFFANDNTIIDDQYVNATILAFPTNGAASGVVLLSGLSEEKTYSVTAQIQSTFSLPILVTLRNESLNKPILAVKSVNSNTETANDDASAILRAIWIENGSSDLNVKNITVMYKTKTTNILSKIFSVNTGTVDTENEGYVYFEFTLDKLITNEPYECSVITSNDIASSQISTAILVSVDSVLAAVSNITLIQSNDLNKLSVKFDSPINRDELTSLGQLKFPDAFKVGEVNSRTYLLVELMDGTNVLDQQKLYRTNFLGKMIVEFDLIDKQKYAFVHKPSFTVKVTSSSKKVVNDDSLPDFIADNVVTQTIDLQGIFADRMVTLNSSYFLSKNTDDSSIDMTVQIVADDAAAFKNAYGGVMSVKLRTVDQSPVPLADLDFDLDMTTLKGTTTFPSTWYNKQVAIKLISKVVNNTTDEHANPEVQIIAPFEVKINPKVTSATATLQYADSKPSPNNPTGILLDWTVNTFGSALTNFRITSAQKPNWSTEVTTTNLRGLTVSSAELVYGSDYTFKIEANHMSSDNSSTTTSVRFGSQVNVFKSSAALLDLVLTTNENGKVKFVLPTTYNDVIETYAAPEQDYYLDNKTTAGKVKAIIKIGSVSKYEDTVGAYVASTSNQPKEMTTVQFSYVVKDLTFLSDEITINRVVMTSVSAALTYLPTSLGLPDDPNGIRVSWDQATFAQTITSFTITCDEAPTAWSQAVAGTESSYVVTSFGTTSLVLGNSYTFNVRANYNNSTVSNTVIMADSIQYGYVLPVFTPNLGGAATITPTDKTLEINVDTVIGLISVNPADYFRVVVGDIKSKLWVTTSATQSGDADFDGALSTYIKLNLTNGVEHNVFIQFYAVVQGRRFESAIAKVTVLGTENIPRGAGVSLVGSPSIIHSSGRTTVSQQINTNGLILDKFTYLAVPTDAMLSTSGFLITSTFNNGSIVDAMWTGSNLTGIGTFSLTISGDYTSSAVIVFVTATLGDTHDGHAIMFGSL